MYFATKLISDRVRAALWLGLRSLLLT